MTLRDSKVETDRAVRSLSLGAITFDEYRARMGYNPLPGKQGANRMIPGNMVVIDPDGKVIISAATTAGDANGGDTNGNQGGDSTESPSTDTSSQKDGIRLVSSNPAR